MAQFILDPERPPRLSAEEIARLDSMSDADITQAALSDPDNPPLTAEELGRLRAVRLVRSVRAASGLSQTRFAAAYHINVARLRDLEQGRTAADSALLAYLTVIAREPDAVSRALAVASRTAND